MENLYSYVFHYNHHTKLWSAIPRDVYNDYWSSKNVKGVISSKKIETLIEMISRGEEFIKTIR